MILRRSESVRLLSYSTHILCLLLQRFNTHSDTEFSVPTTRGVDTITGCFESNFQRNSISSISAGREKTSTFCISLFVLLECVGLGIPVSPPCKK